MVGTDDKISYRVAPKMAQFFGGHPVGYGYSIELGLRLGFDSAAALRNFPYITLYSYP